jgi:hypothetical protein
MGELFWVSYLALWILVGTVALTHIDSWTKVATLRRRVATLANETFGPGDDRDGSSSPWRGRLPNDTGLVLALRTSCKSCATLASEAAAAASRLPPTLVLVDGKAEDVKTLVSASGLEPERVVQVVGVVLKRIGVSGTPSALWLQDGRFTQIVRADNLSGIEALIGTNRRLNKEVAD